MRTTQVIQGRPVEYDEVSLDEAERLQAEGAAVVDVRNADERAAYRVSGSLHIPLPELPARVGELPEGRVLFVCAKGMRSAMAASLAEQAGRDDVCSIAGGTDGWVAAGKPTDR